MVKLLRLHLLHFNGNYLFIIAPKTKNATTPRRRKPKTKKCLKVKCENEKFDYLEPLSESLMPHFIHSCFVSFFK